MAMPKSQKPSTTRNVLHDMVLLLEYCKEYHALQNNVMWQSFEHVRADPAHKAKPIFLDITIPSCLEVASYFTVLLKPHLSH